MKKFSIKKSIKSFNYAFNGLKLVFQEEVNAWVHLFAIIFVVALGIVFKISGAEWVYISLSIGLVFSLEIVNTAIEFLADFVSPEKNEIIKKVKDLSAAAVLFASFAAMAVGIIVFLPKILSL